MKIFCLAILLVWLSIHDAAAQRPCDRWYTNVTTAPSPITETAPGVPGKRIHLCGYVLILGGNGSTDFAFKLFTGTGTNCALDQTVLLGPITLLPSSVLVNRVPYAVGEFAPVGHSICSQLAGNGTLTFILYWAVF